MVHTFTHNTSIDVFRKNRKEKHAQKHKKWLSHSCWHETPPTMLFWREFNSVMKYIEICLWMSKCLLLFLLPAMTSVPGGVGSCFKETTLNFRKRGIRKLYFFHIPLGTSKMCNLSIKTWVQFLSIQVRKKLCRETFWSKIVISSAEFLSSTHRCSRNNPRWHCLFF